MILAERTILHYINAQPAPLPNSGTVHLYRAIEGTPLPYAAMRRITTTPNSHKDRTGQREEAVIQVVIPSDTMSTGNELAIEIERRILACEGYEAHGVHIIRCYKQDERYIWDHDMQLLVISTDYVVRYHEI